MPTSANDKSANFIDLDVLVAGTHRAGLVAQLRRLLEQRSRLSGAINSSRGTNSTRFAIRHRAADKAGARNARRPGAAPPEKKPVALPRRPEQRAPCLGREAHGASRCDPLCGPPRSCWSTSRARSLWTEPVLGNAGAPNKAPGLVVIGKGGTVPSGGAAEQFDRCCSQCGPKMATPSSKGFCN